MYDSRLAEFDITTVYIMSRDQQLQWVKHLDAARDTYALELQQRGHNQYLITKYMPLTDEIVHNTLESDFEDDPRGNNDVRPIEQDSMITRRYHSKKRG